MAADFLPELTANRGVGVHQLVPRQRVELLRDKCPPIRIPGSELFQVLLYEGHGHVLRTQIGGVLGTWDLGNGQQPSGNLFLDPENVHLDVPNLVETGSLRHSDCCACIHADPYPCVGGAEVAQQGDHPKALGRRADGSIELGLTGALRNHGLRLRVRPYQV
jgi:hypothetical protein